MLDITALNADAAWWGGVDTWALVFVAIGVIGEGVAEYHPGFLGLSSSAVKKIGRFSWIILVAALVIELVAQRNKEVDGDLVIAMLNRNVGIAETHTSDRLLSFDDMRRYSGTIDHPGQELHILTLKGDHEAQRFAKSIGDMVSGMNKWKVTFSSFEESYAIGQPMPYSDNTIRIGRMPSGVWGPFGGDPSDGKIADAKIELYGALLAAGFCTYNNSLTGLEDKSPSVITLVVGPKDRQSSDCK